jgi:hypothetical protein
MKLFLPGLLIGALICFLLMRGCGGKVTPIDTHAIDSITANRDSIVTAYKDSVQSYRRAKQFDDSTRNAEMEAKEELERRLSDKISSLTFAVRKYKANAAGKDTVSAMIDCGQIVMELDSIYGIAQSYKLTIDSLTENATNRRGMDSIALSQRDSTISELNKNYDALNHFLQDAVAQNKKLSDALAKTKRGRWLLAGIAALLGGLVVGAVK